MSTSPELLSVSRFTNAPPAGARPIVALSLLELATILHEGFVASSCAPLIVSRFVLITAYATALALLVWNRAFVRFAPRIIPAAAPATPGIATFFVASVGVSTDPDTDQSCAPPTGTVQTVPSHWYVTPFGAL